MSAIPDSIKRFCDAVGLCATGATVMGWLPHILAIPSAVWFTIQIYDHFKSKRADRG